jgi:multiple sugar transport system permease protein
LVATFAGLSGVSSARAVDSVFHPAKGNPRCLSRRSWQRSIMLVIVDDIDGARSVAPRCYFLPARSPLSSNNRLVLLIILASRITPQTVWFMQKFIDAVPLEIGRSRAYGRRQSVANPHQAGAATHPSWNCRRRRDRCITTWNDYTTIAVFAPDTAKRTLQVALVNQVFDAVGISWSFTMAFALIASLPVILMFLLVQKWFIAGLTAGAVKG